MDTNEIGLGEEIKNKIMKESVTSLVTTWFSDTTPFVFSKSYSSYLLLRHFLSERLKIAPDDVIVTGSAAIGVSLNPYKNFKLFDEDSDIDIGIISSHYFEIAWYELLSKNIGILPPKIQRAIDDHRTRLIYWGTIATDKILPVLSFACDWSRVFTELKEKCGELKSREINFRIYKDNRSLRMYIENTINDLKRNLMELHYAK